MNVSGNFIQRISKKLQHPVITLIKSVVNENSYEAYIVGGFVRDLLLNRSNKDIDIVVVGSGIELAEKVSEKLNNAPITIFKNFGTAMIRYKDIEIEFVGARKESYLRNSRKPIVENGTLADDQLRRDFTINTLSISLQHSENDEIIDTFKGIEDLENKIIRTPLEPEKTFDDDPLRMIRAIRFASQLNFKIEENTFNAIRLYANRISIVSKERISDELNKILLSPKPSIGLILLNISGLLEIIFPELYLLNGVEDKAGKKHKDNFYHTVQVVDNISKFTDNLWLRWSALLHDIGKPITKRFNSDLGWTFHGHELIGSKMIPGIFNSLKLPLNEKMKYVQKLVLLHLRPIALVEDEVTDSAIRRLLFDASDDIDDLMLLAEADITSKNDEKVRKYVYNFQIVRNKLKEIEEKDAIRNFQPPISGELIMKVFGITPCKEVGNIKNEIKDAILDGKIRNNYDEAFAFMLLKAYESGLKPVVDITNY